MDSTGIWLEGCMAWLDRFYEKGCSKKCKGIIDKIHAKPE
jgi:hypothetical protein